MWLNTLRKAGAQSRACTSMLNEGYRCLLSHNHSRMLAQLVIGIAASSATTETSGFPHWKSHIRHGVRLQLRAHGSFAVSIC